MLYRKSVACCIALLVISAQANAECEDALKPDKIDVSGRDDIRLALSNTVTKANFDTVQKNGTLSVIYSGLKLGAGYDEFDTWRTTFAQTLNYNATLMDWRSYAATRMSAINEDAYIECLQKPGLKLLPKAITEKAVTIVLRYKTEVGGSSADISKVWSPATGVDTKLEQPIAVNGEAVVTFSRNSEQDMMVSAQATTHKPDRQPELSYTATVLIPKDLKAAENKPPRIKVGRVTYTSRGSASCNESAYQAVKGECDEANHCSFDRNFPFLCGQDPSPGDPKEFSGVFRCGAFSEQVSSGANVAITCSTDGLTHLIHGSARPETHYV
jgi:hypothetical protein